MEWNVLYTFYFHMILQNKQIAVYRVLCLLYICSLVIFIKDNAKPPWQITTKKKIQNPLLF